MMITAASLRAVTQPSSSQVTRMIILMMDMVMGMQMMGMEKTVTAMKGR